MPPHYKLKDKEYSQKYFAKYMREYRKKNPQYVKKDSDKRRDMRKKLLNDHKEFKEEIKEYAQSQLRTVQFKI